MNMKMRPGCYVVAVSGGVDSVVLLHKLLQIPELELIVAHVDHGMRTESADDAKFVESLARQYGLRFESTQLKLGNEASESTARKARYEFLQKIREKYSAAAIITAHHQDDVIETMILNLLRGTNRKGLSSLKSTNDIMRPMLEESKTEITDYARLHKLDWHEDNTNLDTKYLRNFVRHRIVNNLDDTLRQKLLDLYVSMLGLNDEIDQMVAEHMKDSKEIVRHELLSTHASIGLEFVAHWLQRGGIEISKRLVMDAYVFCKTGPVGSRMSLPGNKQLISQGKTVVLTTSRTPGK